VPDVPKKIVRINFPDDYVVHLGFIPNRGDQQQEQSYVGTAKKLLSNLLKKEKDARRKELIKLTLDLFDHIGCYAFGSAEYYEQALIAERFYRLVSASGARRIATVGQRIQEGRTTGGKRGAFSRQQETDRKWKKILCEKADKLRLRGMAERSLVTALIAHFQRKGNKGLPSRPIIKRLISPSSGIPQPRKK